MRYQQVTRSQTAANATALPIVLGQSVASGYRAENVASLPLLDADQQRERLVLEHLPTVRFVARRVRERLPQHVELEELISAGMIGLLDAVEKFDATKQVQFASYAQFRIRGAILDSLRTLDWSPRELRRKGRELQEATRSLATTLGRSPDDSEIAQAMDLNIEAYHQLVGDLKSLEIGSLNEERGEQHGENELVMVQAPVEDDPLFRCLQGEMREQLIERLERLPEKERLVLTLRYYEELTMKEISAILGVVESRVSQIHASAVKRLRNGFARTSKITATAKTTSASKRPAAPASAKDTGRNVGKEF
jgi:RNA polymerase sigma factor for flagellar operon FliA